jgi:hypothetical protein
MLVRAGLPALIFLTTAAAEERANFFDDPFLQLRARAGISCKFLLAVAGALRRCPPLAGRVSACKRIPFRRRIACDPKPLLHLAVLALRRVGRLALHPATTAKMHNLSLRGP